MGLSKYKIGDLINVVDYRNNLGIKNFSGININKEFMDTVANTDNLDETKYKLVTKNRFVFSGMQTGRDECIRISMYTGDETIIVSPAYTTFEIKKNDIILPEYFFMLFLSKEKDRLGWFYSDSSVRANLEFDVFCDIEIIIPSIPVQQKYVDVYNATLENQRVYETGLEDLKLTCDAYIDRLILEHKSERIGKYIEPAEEKNTQLNYGINDVRGISTEKRFIDTKANLNGVSLESYKIIEPNSFAYVTDTSRRGDKIALSLNGSDDTYICSSSYVVFKVSDVEKLIPEFLNIFLSRKEFDRYARFNSWGSARETFDWNEMCDVKMPIPSIDVQKAIVDIHNAYLIRREINEKLKKQIKDICPILIKGSLEEC